MFPTLERLILCAALGLPLAAGAQNAASAAEPDATPVVNSALSPELFYSILLGELNALQAPEAGSTRDAFALLLDAAQRSGDERLFERAVGLAMQVRSGNFALQAVRSWKQAHPLSDRANGYHLRILIALNRVPESVDVLRQQLRRASVPDRLFTLVRLPTAYSEVGDKKLAATLIERTLTPYTEQPETAVAAWLVIARLHAQAGNDSTALDAVRMASSIDGEAVDPVMLAIELMSPGRPMAEAMVSSYLHRHPEQAPLRLSYTRALIQQDRTQEAQVNIERVIAQHPTWPTPHLILGTLLAEHNQFERASASMQEYLRLSVNLPVQESERGKVQAYLVLSQVALKQNDFDRALYWLDRIDNPPDPLSLAVQRASIVAKQGHLNEALSLIAAFEADTEQESRRKTLAQTQLLRDYNKDAQAFDLLEVERKKGNPQPDADLLFEQAMLAEKLKRYEVMEQLLRQHMLLKPKDHQAYNALGYFLADHKLRLTEAKTLIEKALSLVPSDPFVTDSLGWVEFRLGNLDKARSLLEGAFQSKPDAEIAAHLADVYWSLNLPDKALEMAQRGNKLSPSNATLIDTIKRLGLRLDSAK
jgi:predicted Zn-dependent protease